MCHPQGEADNETALQTKLFHRLGNQITQHDLCRTAVRTGSARIGKQSLQHPLEACGLGLHIIEMLGDSGALRHRWIHVFPDPVGE